MLGQVRDLRDPELVRLLLGQPDLVRVRERRRRVGDEPLLREPRLRVLVRRRRDPSGSRPTARRRTTTSAVPVYSGYASISPSFERLQRDLLVAEVELLVDVEAGRLEALRVDLTEDLLLGEVLRADGDLRVGVRLVALDLAGGVSAAVPPAVVIVVVPARAQRERGEQDGDERGRVSAPASSVSSFVVGPLVSRRAERPRATAPSPRPGRRRGWPRRAVRRHRTCLR